MTPAKAPPAHADAEAELARAREALEQLRARVGEGDLAVTADQLAAAEDVVSLAELRISAAAELAARAAEERRQVRLAKIRGSVAGGFLHGRAADVVQAFDVAVESMAALYRSKAAYEADLAATIAEIRGLAPLPAGMQVGRSRIDGTAVVDGHSLTPTGRYSAALLAEAALAGVERAGVTQPDFDGRAALRQAAGSPSRVGRFRRLAGLPAGDGDAAGIDPLAEFGIRTHEPPDAA